MTLEQRIQDLLGKQAWVIVTQQHEIDDLKAKLAALQASAAASA